VMSPAYEKDRKQIAHAAISAVKNNDVNFVRENLLKGLDTMGRYVDEKLTAMPDIGISELCRVENRGLHTAITLLKDMAQELNNCQTHLKPEERLPKAVTEKAANRAESLSMLGVRILEGIPKPANRTQETMENIIASYGSANLMSKYTKYLKELPENKGKMLSEMMSEEKLIEYYDLFGKMIPQLKNGNNMVDQASRDKVISCAMDDTMQKYMGLCIIKGKKGLDIHVESKSMISRMSERAPLKILEEKVPLGPKKAKPAQNEMQPKKDVEEVKAPVKEGL